MITTRYVLERMAPHSVCFSSNAKERGRFDIVWALSVRADLRG